LAAQVLKYQQRHHLFLPIGVDVSLPPSSEGDSSDPSTPTVPVTTTTTDSWGTIKKNKEENRFAKLFPPSSQALNSPKKGKTSSDSSDSVTSK